ncbi:MAG: hypothetical protein ACJ74G_11260 [Blastocatellia bacterium]
MKKDRPFALILAGALMLSLASSLAAQEQTGPRNWHHRSQAASEQQAGSGENHKRDFPRGPGFNLLSSEMRFGDKTVTGAPFSAQVEMESTQTLADGTRATHKGTGMLYRDSEGRIRHEMTVGVLGPFASAGDPPRMVFINDPVANAHYALDATNRTARKMSLPAGRPPHDMTAQGAGHQPPFDVKTESLGKQMIEGIEAEGTRSVITIPAGKFGNDNPVEVTSERWYSQELQTVVMSKHSDPRMGEHVYRLTNIKREEPVRSLFEVPADYQVQEGGFGPGRGGRRGPRQPNEN